MTDAEREINRLISYIRSCREANIDCTVTIDKRLTHGVLNALQEIQQYREIGTVEECREARETQTPNKPKDGLYGHGYFACGSCKNPLDGDESYCPQCGQAIRWEN